MNQSKIQTSFAWTNAKALTDSAPTDGANGTGKFPKSRAGGMKGIGR